jgi:hypothetical protein
MIFGAMSAPASAAGILVREELGFSFLPSGLEWLLQDNGASVIYDLSSQFGAGARFELSFVNDLFVMTALDNNPVAADFGLPFGLDIYPAGVTPVTPDFICGLTDPCYNGFGFIPVTIFPDLAGEAVSLSIPIDGAVAEPATWTLLALALLSLLWMRGRSNALRRV